MKNKCLYLFWLLLSFSSFACLNGETKYLKNGFLVYEDYEGIVPHGHNFLLDSYQTIFKELDSLYAKTGDLDYLSDKGYLLVVQKNTTKPCPFIYLLKNENPIGILPLLMWGLFMNYWETIKKHCFGFARQCKSIPLLTRVRNGFILRY